MNKVETMDCTWQGFITCAESFGQSAFHVAAGPRLAHPAPAGALACHCIELSLKAVLLSRSATPDDLRRYGRNLTRLFNETGLAWGHIDTEAVDFYHDALIEHGLRSKASNRSSLLDPDDLLPIMESVFQRCLEEVAPGAKRTLRPSG